MGNLINKSKAPNDSFSFTLENIDNNERQIELFFLGRTNDYTPKDTGFAIDSSGNFRFAYAMLSTICIQNPNKPYPNGTSDEDCILNTSPSVLTITMRDGFGNSQAFTTDGNNINLAQLNNIIQDLYEAMITNGYELGQGSIQLQFNATPFYRPHTNKPSIGVYLNVDGEDLGRLTTLVRLIYIGDDRYGNPIYNYAISDFVTVTLRYDTSSSVWNLIISAGFTEDVYVSDTLISSNWDGTGQPGAPTPEYTTFDYQDLSYYCTSANISFSILPTWLPELNVNADIPPIWTGFGVSFVWGPVLGAEDGWYITSDRDEGFVSGGVINELPTGEITLNNSTIYNSEGLCTINLPRWGSDSFKLVLTKTENALVTKITNISITDENGRMLVDIGSRLGQGIDEWYDTNVSIKEIANDVIITSNGGLSYKEIQRSQNGEFLHLRAISVQVLSSSASSYYTQNAQNLNSLGFNKNNPFGKDYIQYLNPTISPFQTQNVVNDIKINKNSEVFVLDGDTTFLYTLNPLTSVEITFDYVKFPILLLRYGWKEAEKIIKEKEEQQDIINENYDSRKDYEISGQEISKILNYAKNK